MSENISFQLWFLELGDFFGFMQQSEGIKFT